MIYGPQKKKNNKDKIKTMNRCLIKIQTDQHNFKQNTINKFKKKLNIN